MAQRGLRKQCHRCVGRDRLCSTHDVIDGLDEVDDVGSHGHGTDRLLMACVADIKDLKALLCPDLELMVHLRHERADSVHDDPVLLPRGIDHLGRRAMGAQHQGRASGDLAHVVDEDDSLIGEALHHVLVVDDLVVAVDGRLEGPNHPCKCFDRLLDAGTEPPGFGQQHLIDVHVTEATRARRR